MRIIIFILIFLISSSFGDCANTKLSDKYWVSGSFTTYGSDKEFYSEYEIEFISTNNDTIYKVFNLNNSKDTVIAYWVDDVLTIDNQTISTNDKREIIYRGNGLIKNGYLEITLSRFDFFHYANSVITCIDSNKLYKNTFISTDKNWFLVQKHKSFSTWQYLYKYYFNGFSNIKGTIYHQLCYYNVKKGPVTIKSYWRESGDSLYQLSSEGKDSLIFCFNLEKGDILETETQKSWIVDSLLNEIWNGKNIKSWYLSSNNEKQMIWNEDIGNIQSISGLVVENSDSINMLFEFYVDEELIFRDNKISHNPIFNYEKNRFVSENNLWSIISKGGSSENMWKVTTNLKFIGDSTLNETRYSKLFESTDNGENWNFSSLWYENNDSIFSYSTYHKKDLLIYDFNLEESDSFYIEESDGRYLYVDSVRTQLWGNSERKIIFLGTKKYSDRQTIWIQGVGQDGYILRSTEVDICGAICNILCFHENGEQIYQNPDYSTCYINTKTAVSTLEYQAKLIEVFPCNIGTLTIRISNQQQGEFILFDLEGRKILQQNINDTETQLCLPQSGIFIYRFTSNEGEIQTGKVMVN